MSEETKEAKEAELRAALRAAVDLLAVLYARPGDAKSWYRMPDVWAQGRKALGDA